MLGNVKFSIVIPTYNRAHLIGRALKSVGAQTLKAHEVIVVDDGSVDDIASVIQAIGMPIRLLRQENSGAASARNLGIQHATADWIAFLDSDDFWEINHLEELSSLVTQWPDAGIAYCGYAVLAANQEGHQSQDTEVVKRVTSYTEKDGPKLGEIFTSACAIQRSLLLEIGGFPPFRCGEDTAVIFDIGTRFPLACSNRITSYYVRHGAGIMDTEKLVEGLDQVNALLCRLVVAIKDDSSRRNASRYTDSRILSKIKSAILRVNKNYVASNYGFLQSTSKKQILSIFLLLPDFVWRFVVRAHTSVRSLKIFFVSDVHEK